MSYQIVNSKKKISVRNSVLILIGFATAFFPRLPTYFGAPPTLNFVHFIVIPAVTGITMLTSRIKDSKQISVVWELIFGMGILLACTIVSALINQAGIINVFLQYMLQAEPYLLLLAIMATPLAGENLKNIRKWFMGFCLFNMLLAIAQSILLPLGLYPGARGGQLIADNTAGVFASPGGSAGNYISCTISLYFALYFFSIFKTTSVWIRLTIFLFAIYQAFISDSKQIFLALVVGHILLVCTNIKRPIKLLAYLFPIILLLIGFNWALHNPAIEFLDPYRNWTTYRTGLYGPDGEATLTKLAAFRIIPSYYETPLNWFFGLGPGHTVTRLGGWMLPKYAPLLNPLGATTHPASQEIFQVVYDGWIAKESTIFFPLFTWAGIWGDLGIVGLGAYLYLGFIVWKRICVDDFCRFLLLSTVVLGFILTQMEEPGHMLTVAFLMGLRCQEKREATVQLRRDCLEVKSS